MKHQEEQRTLLGEAIDQRLTQLGMSRREFCRRNHISRPTLHDLEYINREFLPSTFEVIDQGLKWNAGTAFAYYQGKENARTLLDDQSSTERIGSYLEQILRRIITMNEDELERELLMLEEELYGRPLRTDQASLELIKETVGNLLDAMKGNRETEAFDGIG